MIYCVDPVRIQKPKSFKKREGSTLIACSRKPNDQSLVADWLASHLFSLFACPKSNQKRPPAMKQPIAGTKFQLSFCNTVVKNSGALMSLITCR
jgi:hypothetical protein